MSRRASSDDVAELVSAYEWLFAPPGSKPGGWDPEKAAERLLEAIASDDAEIFVVEVDGAIAGFISAYWDIHSVRFGRRVWVEDLAVDPDQRSQGLGKALLDAAKDWARARGASHLELDSATTRADAHRFYEREQPSWTSMSFGWVL